MSDDRHGLTFPGDCDARGRITFDMPQAVTAYCRRRFAGQRVDVEIRARKAKRSLLQNAYIHAAWKGWADHLGYDVEALKDELLGLVFGYREVTSPITGEVRQVLVEPHTSRLTVPQMSELMERAVIEAAGTGYDLLLPDEWHEARTKAARQLARRQSAA